VLLEAGAEVGGYALAPATDPSLYALCGLESKICAATGDIRDLELLQKAFDGFYPEIVIHMAAQPLVIDSYKEPAYTFDVNVMGTVNILECVRHSGSTRAFLNVTTDKVYRNNEWHWGYRENDELCGRDPYSNSKSCSELVTYSYRESFFGKEGQAAVATARAGNVIGGGDFSENRILPDCVRAAMENKKITIRNKHAIRPWQHVLEPLCGYLMILKKLYEEGGKYAGAYNIGPKDEDCVPVGRLADLFCKYWPGTSWEHVPQENAVHEASFLKLDNSKTKNMIGYSPRWDIGEAVKKTVEWSRAFADGKDVYKAMRSQISEYFKSE